MLSARNRRVFGSVKKKRQHTKKFVMKILRNKSVDDEAQVELLNNSLSVAYGTWIGATNMNKLE